MADIIDPKLFNKKPDRKETFEEKLKRLAAEKEQRAQVHKKSSPLYGTLKAGVGEVIHRSPTEPKDEPVVEKPKANEESDKTTDTSAEDKSSKDRSSDERKRRLNELSFNYKAPDAPDLTSYDEAVRASKREYEGDKEDIDRREMIESIANAVGKVGAGMAGNKAGVDMSQTKFESRDWDKKRDRAFQEHLADLERTGAERRETVESGRQREAVAIDLAKLETDTAYRNEMLKLEDAQLDARQQDMMNSMAEAQKSKIRKDIVDTTEEFRKLSQQVADSKLDEAGARQEALTLLTMRLGLDDQTAAQILTEKHKLWADTEAEFSENLDEILENMRNITVDYVLSRHVPVTIKGQQILVNPNDPDYQELLKQKGQ